MKPARQSDWYRIEALGLGLPGTEETASWGQPTPKAHDNAQAKKRSRSQQATPGNPNRRHGGTRR
jgi:hypothetical protein